MLKCGYYESKIDSAIEIIIFNNLDKDITFLNYVGSFESIADSILHYFLEIKIIKEQRNIYI